MCLTRSGAAVPLAGLHEGEGDSLAALLPVRGGRTLASRCGGGRGELWPERETSTVVNTPLQCELMYNDTIKSVTFLSHVHVLYSENPSGSGFVKSRFESAPREDSCVQALLPWEGWVWASKQCKYTL